MLGNNFLVLYVLSTSITHIWRMRFPARALFEAWGLEVAQQEKHPTWLQITAVVRIRAVHTGCAWENPEQTERASQTLLRSAKGGCGSVFYSALITWPSGYTKRGLEGDRQRRLGCFCISHEKSSTVLSHSLNVFTFLTWLVLSDCLMGWRKLFSRHSCITDWQCDLETFQGPNS